MITSKNILWWVQGVIASLTTLFVLSLFALPASAASAADCDSRGNPTACKNEINNRCKQRNGAEKEKCINNVLSKYVITGLGVQGGVKNCPSNTQQTNDCLTNLPGAKSTPSQLTAALRIVFGIASGVALIALLIAAFNYATASTDMDKVARSKKGIIAALMGLVITLGAQALVLTVLDKL